MADKEPRREPARAAGENDGRAPTRAIAEVARILRRRRRGLTERLARDPSSR